MRTIYLLTILFFSLSLRAQTPFPVKIPGSAFSLENGSDRATIDDVSDGRRFRGKGFAKLTLRANFRMPASSSADPKMQRLIVRFRTSRSGPSLRSVEVRNGSSFRLDTHAEGDFTTRETAKVNTWVFTPPVPLSAQSILHLEVQFPGGFDSPINPGEFVITSVEVDFPLKAIHGSPTVNNNVPAVITPAGTGATGVIYALSNDNSLLWYQHIGRSNGSFQWTAPTARTVGTGWDFKQIFPGDDGVIYAITNSGDLLWYRHDGRNNGSFRWAFNEGKKVGNGWNFKQVFSGGNGVIYAITDNGDLLWYRHDGRADGSFRWAFNEGKKVGNGWNFKQVFSGGDGLIYAITDNGDLLWYRHDGRADGSFRWAFNEGKKVGNGWNFKQVFPGGDGIIYAVAANDDLLWYRHDGRADGSFRWAFNEGKKVGNGWNFKQIFSQ